MDPVIARPTTTTTIISHGGGGGDHDGATNIVKRKRTKRQRPTTILTHSPAPCNAFNPSLPTSHFHETVGHDDTVEDEDIATANSLILLSKGRNVYSYRNNNNSSNGNGNSNINTEEKFCSKRYIQISPNGLTGMYVYECKTCGRTFPTFQALGGHRASHNKPPRTVAFSDEDEPSTHSTLKKNHSSFSSSLCMQVINHTKKSSSSKLHECSICAAEFNSGQALGGHMRRHRATNTNTANTALSLIPYRPLATFGHGNQRPSNGGLCLDLDLNLPAAPETVPPVSNEGQHRESSFKFTANLKKQQPAVRLTTAPTLVDCQY